MNRINIPYGIDRAEVAKFALSQGTPSAMQVLRIEGNCDGADSYLQIFDSLVEPGANAVPLWCGLVTGNNGFLYDLTSVGTLICATGVYIALSTDPTKYVADTSGTTISGDVDVQAFDETPGTSFGSSTTNNAASVTIDAKDTTPVGKKAIVRMMLTNGEAVDVFFCIITDNTKALGQKVCWSGFVPAGETAEFDFGVDGFLPSRVLNDHTIQYGSTIVKVLASVASAAGLENGLPTLAATANANFVVVTKQL